MYLNRGQHPEKKEREREMPLSIFASVHAAFISSEDSLKQRGWLCSKGALD